MAVREFNFDGIVGPTHNYAGLSFGNIASMSNLGSVSNPKAAALEGISKMRLLASLGVPQAVLPPPLRPDVPTLRSLGFGGSDANVLAGVPEHLLAKACSASAMWCANAATISPSGNTRDGRLHITPANLLTQFHRSIEARTTTRVLRAVFRDDRFVVHDPLPASPHFADEGAANHTRLGFGEAGLEVFTWGRVGFDPSDALTRFPARQTLESYEAVARRHGTKNAVFVRQSARAIDAGAFHNDVVCVGHRDILLIHATAWEDQSRTLDDLRRGFERPTQRPLRVIEIDDDEVPIADAVASYLFNSQIVAAADGRIMLIAPAESRENTRSAQAIDRIVGSGLGIDGVHFVDVRQSMRNGGGPACLRLRVELTDAEVAALHPGVVFTPELDAALVAWVERHYRSELRPEDLRDPGLLRESRDALQSLAGILKLDPAAILDAT